MLLSNVLQKHKDKYANQPLALAIEQGLLSKEVSDMLRTSYENSGHKRVRVVCLATDFYVTLLLKDVLANRAGGESGYDPVTKETCFIFDDPMFLDWAIIYQKTVSETLKFSDRFMFTYLCAAVAGELRHSFGKLALSDTNKIALKSFGIEGGSLSRSATQHQFLAKIKANQLEEYLNLAVTVFNKYQWGGSYGGPKWGEIAQTGLDRLLNKLDAVSFVDRVYDLKHNGGPIFDKNKAVDNSYVQQLLDAKLNAKSDGDWTPWLKYCSEQVRECLAKAKAIGLWSGIDPKTKELVPSIYSSNQSASYNAAPDLGGYKQQAKQVQQSSAPDYPLVQEVAACPHGKKHE